MLRMVTALALLTAVTQVHSTPPQPIGCTAPEYHQMDFWLGDWDTFGPDGKLPSQALNHVESILGGCVIHERYLQTDGLHGESFSIYDASRKIWHQSWVTNRGALWVLEGTFKDGTLTLSGTTVDKDGRKILHRATWKTLGGGVQEIADSSRDGGKTWNEDFNVLFLKHRDMEGGVSG